MSSPLPVEGGSQSQEVHDTPTTTPPAPISNSATPAPENDDAMEVDLVPEDSEAKDDSETESASISLPISKIKRIFKMDPDFVGASQSAVYATGVATELFIQYLTEQASVQAKIDKRKKVMYKDFSTAVASQEALNFLSDTVPKTIPLKDIIHEVEQANKEKEGLN